MKFKATPDKIKQLVTATTKSLIPDDDDMEEVIRRREEIVQLLQLPSSINPAPGAQEDQEDQENQEALDDVQFAAAEHAALNHCRTACDLEDSKFKRWKCKRDCP